MEKLNLIFLFIIVFYFVFSFLKRKKEYPDMASTVEEKKEQGEMEQREHAVIAAALAATLGEARYKVKKILLVSKSDEKESRWKAAGRQEGMLKRTFFRTQ
jgi:Na+-transporting methylmalonyl-CoA/oxaloacetate decarboxylase gamma subunit